MTHFDAIMCSFVVLLLWPVLSKIVQTSTQGKSTHTSLEILLRITPLPASSPRKPADDPKVWAALWGTLSVQHGIDRTRCFGQVSWAEVQQFPSAWPASPTDQDYMNPAKPCVFCLPTVSRNPWTLDSCLSPGSWDNGSHIQERKLATPW